MVLLVNRLYSTNVASVAYFITPILHNYATKIPIDGAQLNQTQSTEIAVVTSTTLCSELEFFEHKLQVFHSLQWSFNSYYQVMLQLLKSWDFKNETAILGTI